MSFTLSCCSTPSLEFGDASRKQSDSGFGILPLFYYHHYPRLWKKDVTADIEIHRLPVITIKHSTHFGADIILQFKKEVSKYPGCYVLSDDYKVILSFMHRHLTNARHALVGSLNDVYDIYCFLKRVDLKRLPQASPFKQKSIAYFKISEKLLNLPCSFYPSETIGSKLYRVKHDLNFTSTYIYEVNRFVWVLSEAISYAIQKVNESFTDSPLRVKIIRRLFTLAWNQRNFKSYRGMYKGHYQSNIYYKRVNLL